MESDVFKPNGTGVGRIIKAGRCSMQGFEAAYRYESAFRQELLLAFIMFPISIFIAADIIQLVLLNGAMLIVLLVEIINSALEAVVDRISLEMHELSGRVKDLGSSAVFISLVLYGLIWISIIYRNFYSGD
ncbi:MULTISPECIES: diacylglycerol kinase [unclassified Shewanella]|uniref:diacylglycerol kinase n=1 Tax=unclassified Shewanella TaxID=196818 RepID=UPI002005F77F|nr:MULTISPECIES: diacylglycerol kinase [unclassified Shewanella]MCK7633224.1 diacylglycerol kinase [Shewanella sp. JNE17]MCK7648449.1 diacylglycerol kinase [Shewanella sp. JNE8]MCK7656530.1 diacylglycerol kinase [Shewanella sp. JNE4-2]UPO29567.1 diacylglycerol kinase [Shewanella sp. JNE2]